MKRLGVFLFVWVVSALTGSNSRGASIADLGILPDYTDSGAAAISADGKIVVGSCSKYVNGQNIVEPFIWTAGQGMVGLGWLPGCTNCVATSVSTNGVVVGNCTFTNAVVAFKWRAQDGYIPLTSLYDEDTSANSISANGEVIVGVASHQAAKWNVANEVTLLPFAEARDVSGDGRVIVGYDVGPFGLYVPVRWREGDGNNAEDINSIGALPEGFTLYTANGVSLDGEFIVGYCKTPLYEEAYIWSAATGVKNLGNIDSGTYVPSKKTAANPLPFYAEGYAVSNDGNSVVGRTFPLSETFIWTAEDGAQTLAHVLNRSAIFDPQWNTTQSFGSSTTDISADGTMIVGEMPRISVGNRAFLLDLRNIKAVQIESGLQLTWPEGFKLQQSNGVHLNSWQDIAGATSPFPISTSGDGQFYRIVHVP